MGVGRRLLRSAGTASELARCIIIALCLALLWTTGCGTDAFPAAAPEVTSAISTACSASASAASTSTGDAPVITPSATTISIYPGQTTTLQVAISASSNKSKFPVILGASSLPQGLTIDPVATETGATATLTLAASTTIASNCFTGTVLGLDSVSVPLVLQANTAIGEVELPVVLNVVLENPTFVPTVTNLPVMTITTADGASINSNEDYVDTAVAITDASDSNYDYSGTGEIKGHGNTTWEMPKKPYKIKLASKAPLLGMKTAKDWILLANYDDKPMLRTALAFEISNIMELYWTPSAQFIELYLNGTYEGTYQLSEEVEIDPNRLNIPEVTDTDNSGTAITGGYLFEIDFHYDEDFMTTSPRGLAIGSQDPNPPTTAQEAYITPMIATAENALYSTNYLDPTTGWRAYMDESTFVDWYLAEELMGNNDAAFYSSDFFYKLQNDTHFYMGPVWDFDVSSGNVNYSEAADPNVAWVRDNALWYEQLFTDPSFLKAVQTRWTAIRPNLDNLSTFLQTSADSLNTAQANNFARWPILGELVWPNTEAANSYPGEVDFLQTWMSERLAYMDSLYLLP